MRTTLASCLWRLARTPAAGLLLAVAGGSIVATVEEPAAADAETRLDAAELSSLRGELDPRRQPWATIPWVASVTAARHRAFQEGKPIFLVVNTGNCLGFV